MAVEAKSAPLEDQQEHEQQVQRHDAPAHNPSAPPDELFDISTTVDPSYVISLIRKLLPANASNNHNSHGDVFDAHVQGLDSDLMEKTAPTLSRDRLLQVSNDGSERTEIADDFHKSAPKEEENNNSYDGAEQCGDGVPVGKEAWEEYGCILWDLAASKTHAELMVANSCVTAGVLVANILSDEPNLASEISQDFPFLQGLLDIFPLSSEDLEARSALWNIIARLLVRVQENEMSPSALQQYVSVLVSKSDVIEDDLLDCQLDGLNSKARTTSLRRIISILNRWAASKDDAKENEMMGKQDADNISIDRLLDCRFKHSEYVQPAVSQDMDFKE